MSRSTSAFFSYTDYDQLTTRGLQQAGQSSHGRPCRGPLQLSFFAFVGHGKGAFAKLETTKAQAVQCRQPRKNHDFSEKSGNFTSWLRPDEFDLRVDFGNFDKLTKYA
jgi:hypothetical protein